MSTSDLLRKYGLSPKKSLGQNFLADTNILQKIAGAAEIGESDEVLEIGPGLGSLTAVLAGLARRVVAVEIDRNLLGPLGEVLAPHNNVQVVQGDILKLAPAEFIEEAGYLVVANIPYNITSALIRHLLEAEKKPARIVLTIQQEVAQRLLESPPKTNLLGLSVQVYGRPEMLFRIPAGAFFPAPKVDSAVVRIDLFDSPLIPAENLARFFSLAKAGFGQKRKNLRNALAGGMGWTKDDTGAVLAAAGIDHRRRAETLSISEWGDLVKASHP